MEKYKVVGFMDYKDPKTGEELLLGDDGTLLKPNPKDPRISRAFKVGHLSKRDRQKTLLDNQFTKEREKRGKDGL